MFLGRWGVSAVLLIGVVAGTAALMALSPRAAATQPVATPTPAASTPAAGTAAAAEAEARALTEALRHAGRSPAGGPAAAGGTNELARQAERRRTLLVSLATSRPQAVLDLALQPAERAALPDSVRQLVEERVAAEGELQVYHVDDADGQGPYAYKLWQNGRRRDLRVTGTPAGVASTDVVQVSGVALPGTDLIVVEQIALVRHAALRPVPALPAPSRPLAADGRATGPSGSTGGQRTAVILVNGSQASAAHPYANKTSTAGIVFSYGNPLSAANYFYAQSYHLVDVVGGTGTEGSAADVYGPYTLSTSACDIQTVDTAAFNAADPELDFNRYDRVLISYHGTGCES